MGTLGYSSQMSNLPTELPTELRTKRFLALYLDRIAELRHTTSGQKAAIMMEVIKQEQDWLSSMGEEYDEIMRAQEIMDKIKP